MQPRNSLIIAAGAVGAFVALGWQLGYLNGVFAQMPIQGNVPQTAAKPPQTSSDAPDRPRDPTVKFKAAGSYDEALRVWKTPEDISAWLAAHFDYDMARALRLSETQRAKGEPLAIYTPTEFFKSKSGVCVDIARFGVETLKSIDAKANPKYLMIEFDPVQITGNTLRLHWLVSFQRDGKAYFFADSKRPGHMAGPYADAKAFIDEYAQYRGRKIVAFRELDSYQKQQKKQAAKDDAKKKV